MDEDKFGSLDFDNGFEFIQCQQGAPSEVITVNVIKVNDVEIIQYSRKCG